MRRFVSYAALTALLAATSCSEQEIIPAGPGMEGNSETAVLGITTGVKASSTKAIVEGTMLSYKTADYAAQPGLGIVMLNSDGTGFYGEKAADQTLAKNHIWFMGDPNGENWKSISALGSSFAGATAKGFTLLNTVGTVYAYYPKAADDKLSGDNVDDLTLTVPLQTTGTITFDDKVTNADMKFNASGSTKWSTNSSIAKKVVISYPDETDYLYAYNADRYVNSGRMGDGIAAGNADETNPGREIALTMNHALSMVSFRVYNDGSLAGDGLLTKVKIRNVDTKSSFKAGKASTMSLATGAITSVSEKDSIVRTIENYTIPCAIASGDTETQFKFIPSGSTVTGPKVARKMSLLVYPMASIPEGELEVVFTIDGKEYPVSLPVTDVSSWIAGENQLYTVCASERKLTITSVEVTEWIDGTGGDIEL